MCRSPPWQANASSSLPNLAPYQNLVRGLAGARPMAIRQAAAAALTSLLAPDDLPPELTRLLEALSAGRSSMTFNQASAMQQHFSLL